MPRVLILGEFPTLNGGERSLLAVLPTIQAAGWQIAAHVPTVGPFASALQALGIEVYAAPPSGTALDDRRGKLAEHLRLQRFDLVHANSLAMGRMAGPVAAAATTPSLAHLRDIIGLNTQAVADLNQNSRLLAVSRAVADFHAAQGLERNRLQVLHNGVDLSVFRPSRLDSAGPAVRGICSELRIPIDSQLIAIIGQIILRKGQDIALTAAVEVLRDRPRAHTLVIGTRHSTKPETVEFENRLHRIVAAGGVADRVHFLGTRDDLPTLLPLCDVLLHAAHQEPLGRVLLEAAACGLPVVATDVGGTREIFPHGVEDGAILIPPDDAPAARAALDRLLGDDANRERMGMAGRRRAEAAFSVERSAVGLLEQYRSVAANGS